MHEPMRYQVGVKSALSLVDQGTFGDSIVARFMMFEPELRDLIAERDQKMIVAIMSRAEQRASLGDQLSKMCFHIGRHGEIRRRISRYIHFVRWILAGRQLNSSKIAPSNHGRVNERIERNGRELDGVSILLWTRQSRAEFPSRG